MSQIIGQVLPPPRHQQAIKAKRFHPDGKFVEFKKEETDQSIPERFEKIVRQYPQRIAVKSKSRTLTYEELDAAANRFARILLDRSGNARQTVALIADHDAPTVVAMIGILKAGKICLPVDPSYPEAMIKYILGHSRATATVTTNRYLSLARSISEHARELIVLDERDKYSLLKKVHPRVSPDSVAAILYTSGSTGEPKGVMQTHRNILHMASRQTNSCGICADDRVSLFSSLVTAYGMMTAFYGLLNGAAVCLFNVRENGMQSIANWLITEKITVYMSPPAVFRGFSSDLTGQESFPDIRLIRSGGERICNNDLAIFRKYFSPKCLFSVVLSSSETGAITEYFFDKETESTGEAVPVGYRVDGVEVLLLDKSGTKVGFNTVGEIAVKSGYLSPGYWGRPDLTRANFLADPNGGDERIYLTGDLGRITSDGCLFHLGRKDLQVKVRGYRTEVDEIETALLEHPGIKDAAVVAREPESSDKRLVAYFVSAGPSAPTVTVLRKFLKDKLPDYMIPSAFVVLPALPLTANGKVDRFALPTPEGTRPELDIPFTAPGTPIEEELAGIWAEVLSLDRVGIHDNFFDLGGHSLAAMRAISQVVKRYHLEIPLQSLFQSPTVAEMAAVISGHQSKKLGDAELQKILAELESLSDEDAQRLLAGQGGREKPGL